MAKLDFEPIIFVYNADSGPVNGLLDGMHKVLSPTTYECNLCVLTHGAFTEKPVWKRWRRAHAHPMRFYHRDDFLSKYASKFGAKFTFPIVLVEGSRGLEVLVSTEELNGLKSVRAFIRTLDARLAQMPG